MKKNIILFLSIMSILLVGCGKKSNKEVLNKISDKINNTSAYHVKGKLNIINGEDNYDYEVDVSYQAKDKYRVSLKNIVNNHIQILLKNEEGVYVLTPSLNKSFKFQSDWPYNNSQVYLYQTIIKDIENDKEHKIEKTNDGYKIESKVNYSNNKELVKQIIYLNNNLEINKVEVLDKDNKPQLTMNFDSIDFNPTFDDNYFASNNEINTSASDETVKDVGLLDNIIYPLYMPENTKLVGQDIIDKAEGKRVILTFDGDKSFMFIQETISKNDNYETISVSGEPMQIGDTVGAVSNSSVTWQSNGVEYYITSSSLESNELVNIANSISAIPVGK